MAKLSEIEGIGDVYSSKLEAEGINTVEKLLDTCATKKARKALADTCDISETLVLNWTNRADLARVKGVSTQYADLLEFAGVDTVPELAQRNAANLHAKMTELNTEKNLVRKVAGLSQVEDWVAQAKQLPRVMTY